MNPFPILLSVASIWTLAVMTPGPNFFITAQTAVNHSRKNGLFIVLGTCTGTIIWSVAGFFGIASLFIIAPWLYTTLKIAGGGYLLYLGVMMITRSGKNHSNPDSFSQICQSRYLNWRKGLITNLANPKTAMFITSLFATVLPKEPTIVIGILVLTLMAAISLVWYSFVVVIFSSKSFKYFYKKMQKWLERMAGIVFIGFGAKLIFSDK